MGAKISKAQIEVWEWKEKAYEEVKDLSIEDAVKYILAQTRPIIEELKRKRKNKEEHAS